MFLQKINDSGRKMLQLINDMLLLAHVGAQEIKCEHVDLSVMVREFLKELKDAEPARKVKFVVQEGIHVKADVRLLHIAIENLLKNAWKFTARRDVADIEFGTELKEQATVFFVRDNGVGFDIQFAEKIFLPFKRVHPAKEFAGTGIGLSIVRRVINRLGGKIWAVAEIEKGATFYFTMGEMDS